MVEDGENTQGFMAKIIWTQHVDATYDSVNFDDPISTLFYFKKIEQSFFGVSDETDYLESMMWFFKMRTEEGSKISAEVQMHQIMRSAAEKIHGAFRKFNRDSSVTSTTAIFVNRVIWEAKISLLHLMKDCIDEDSKHRTLSS